MLTIKKKVSEHFGFYLICLVLLSAALIDNDKTVTNIYRVWVCLPLLLCVRWLDVKAFIHTPFAKLFLALTLWSTLSLFWSDSDTLKNMAIKLLTTTVFLYGVFLVHRYQREKTPWIESVFIAAACMLGVAILIKFDASAVLYYYFPLADGYSVFGSINGAAWFFSAALLVSLFQVIDQKGKTLAILAVPFLCYLLLQTYSLAAGLSVMAGVIFFIVASIKKPYHTWAYSLFTLLLVATIVVHCVYPNELLTFYQQLDGPRVEIYQSAYQRITSSWQALWWGEGLAASARNTIASGVLINNWHSIYLNTVFYTGLIGLALFLACVSYRLQLILRKKAVLCAWDLAVVGALVAFMFDGNRLYSYPGGIFMSLVVPLFMANFQRHTMMKHT